MSKSKYLVGIMATIMVCMFLGPATATPGYINTDETITPPGSDVPVVLSTTYYGETWIQNEFYGKIGWSNEFFVLTVDPAGGDQQWFSIRLYDRFLVGDFYELWEVSPDIQFIGATPQVDTGPYHGPDPADPPFIAHTGTGTVFSDGTFTVVKQPGVYKYRVRDPFFEHDAGYSPAGWYIHFGRTAPAPELPIAVPLVVSLMVIALVPLKRKLWKK